METTVGYRDAQGFEELKQDLADLFISTAAQFAQNHGFKPMSEQALRQMTTPLTATAGEVLMFGCDVWPESARCVETAECAVPFETSPSEVDPPRAWFWTFATLLVTLPLSIIVAQILHGPMPGFFYALGVIGAAVVFSWSHGLVLAGFSSLLHNFFVMEPVLTLSMPNKFEVYTAFCYATLAIAMPWILRRAHSLRRRALAIPLLSEVAFQRLR